MVIMYAASIIFFAGVGAACGALIGLPITFGVLGAAVGLLLDPTA